MGQTWLIGGSVAVLLLIHSIGATVIPLPEFHFSADRYNESSGVRAEDGDYRLPVTVIPNRYRITLTPNFDDFNFVGEVDIEVTAESATRTISLHYDSIIIDTVTVTSVDDKNAYDVSEQYDPETNIYTLTLTDEDEPELEPGNYIIHIEYTGQLRDDMSGFYKSSYTIGDNDVR